MVIFKVLGALALGSGVGVPVAMTINKPTDTKVHHTVNNFDSVVKIDWVGKKLNNEIGELINGLGELIHKDNQDDKKAEIIGIKLTSWGQFKPNSCKELGFDSKDQKDIGCFQEIKLAE